MEEAAPQFKRVGSDRCDEVCDCGDDDRNVSMLFPDVISCIHNETLELKKLVYL